MTRQQAINYLRSSGFTDEQIKTVADALSTQPEETCDTCKHGFFGSEKCNNCRVGYPSNYERIEE